MDVYEYYSSLDGNPAITNLGVENLLTTTVKTAGLKALKLESKEKRVVSFIFFLCMYSMGIYIPYF